MFQRDVDCCSGAFLLTKMQVFRELGGFDERFAPGCYEAADYCVRVWESGRRVVYDPDAVIIHEEFGGAGGSALALQAADRDVFVGRHAGWLALRFEAAPANLLAARTARSRQPRILVLEDRVSKPELGAGYPRSNRLLHELLAAGAQVTLFPMYRHQESWESVRRVLDKRIEVSIHAEGSGIGAYLSARRGIYDAILVCRPHNMNVLLEAMGAERDLIETAKLIYDAEALFVTRTLQRMEADGRPATELERRRLSAKEIMLAWCADEVISVSAAEKEVLETYGAKRIQVLGHALEDAPLPSGFEARDQIVFLGAMPEDDAPNADALRWFASEILPEIRRSLGQNLRLTLIGRAEAPTIRALDGDRVELLGMVDALAPALARARLLVVPTRFAAGLPHKVHQAAMLGIPMVVTELIFGQLGRERDADVMVADDPQGFAAACVRLYRDRALWERIRGNARACAVKDCDPEAFRATVGEIVSGIPLRRRHGEAPECGASASGNSEKAGGSALQ
jgi:glycosyltransferase involved in cell wall biosynthesis